ERCSGEDSNTTRGLYDIDDDGKPEYVALNASGGFSLQVYPLVGGSTWGIPEAGKLVAIGNGYGAVNTIKYRSAKEAWRTGHQIPFPEIVVTKSKTTGTAGLGGTLAATQYAYGGIELVFDSTLDMFRPTGYLRRVELAQTSGPGYPQQQATALITDRYPLATF